MGEFLSLSGDSDVYVERREGQSRNAEVIAQLNGWRPQAYSAP